MTRPSSYRWFSPLLSLPTFMACDTASESSVSPQPVADTSLRPGRQGIPSAAVDAIADARCGRAQRCGRVGPGHELTSRFDCTRRVRAEWSEELNRIDCERGVDEGALQTCLRQLSARGCDGEDPPGACRALALCEPEAEPPPVPLIRDPAVPG